MEVMDFPEDMGVPDSRHWIISGFVMGTFLGITFGKILTDLIWGMIMPLGGLQSEKMLWCYLDGLPENEETFEVTEPNEFETCLSE